MYRSEIVEGSQIVIVCVKVEKCKRKWCLNGADMVIDMVIDEELPRMTAIYVCAMAAKGNTVNTPWQWIPFQ